jgi:predicted DNA-binding transcriptional regulator AlpA
MKLLDIPKIAEMLDLNPAHVRDRLTKRADFPAGYRIGGALRWNVDDITEWIESRKVTPNVRRSKKRTLGSTSTTHSGSRAQTSAQAQAVAESSTAA